MATKKKSSVFSKVKNAYRGATKALQSFGKNVVAPTLSKVGSTLSKTGLAAVASAPLPNKSVAPNKSTAPTSPIGTTTKSPNATSAATKKPVYISPTGQQFVSSAPTNVSGLEGGNIDRAIATGQLPRDIGSGRGATPGGLGTPTIPQTLTSESLSGGVDISSSFSQGGAGGSFGGGASTSTGAGGLLGGAEGAYATMENKSAYDIQKEAEDKAKETAPDPYANLMKWTEGQLASAPEEADPERIRRQLEKETDYVAKQQEVNNLTGQLKAVQARSQAAQIALQGQGRGITTDILSEQAAEINRRAAIEALPIAADLAVAQGNLALAQDHIDTWLDYKVAAAERKYNKWKTTFDAVRPIMTAKEQRIAEEWDKKKQYEREDEKTESQRAWELYKMKINPSPITTRGIGQPGIQYANDLDAIVGTVLSTIPSKFGQQTFTTQISKARNDADRLNIVAAQVLQGQPAEFKNDFRNQAVGIAQLDKAIAELDNGVQTGVLQNTAQYLYNIVGKDFDPKIAKINNYITSAIQPYRNSVTGAAWGEQEDGEYQQLFGSTRYSPAELRQRLVQTKELLKSKSSEGLNSFVNPLGTYDNRFDTGTLAPGGVDEGSDIFDSVVSQPQEGGYFSNLWNALIGK